MGRSEIRNCKLAIEREEYLYRDREFVAHFVGLNRVSFPLC